MERAANHYMGIWILVLYGVFHGGGFDINDLRAAGRIFGVLGCDGAVLSVYPE